MNAILRFELDPIAIDPRPCEFCGLPLEQHVTIDGREGPEHFCPDPCLDCGLTLDRHECVVTDAGPEFRCLALPELERRAELRRQEEIAAMVERMERADPRDRWKHTGEPPPPPEVRNGPMPAATPKPYRTPQATVDAFWYVVGLDDLERLAKWLDDHPRDKPTLLKLLESK
jgi:hypothetical protein